MQVGVALPLELDARSAPVGEEVAELVNGERGRREKRNRHQPEKPPLAPHLAEPVVVDVLIQRTLRVVLARVHIRHSSGAVDENCSRKALDDRQRTEALVLV